MNFQKRLVQAFKTFVEKVFLPQCHKNESVMQEWNRFNSLISEENINLAKIQQHVVSIGQINIQNLPNNAQRRESQQGMYGYNSLYTNKNFKKQQGSYPYQKQLQQINSFNPSKTFGGQRNKIPPYNVVPTNKGSTQQEQMQNNSMPQALGNRKTYNNNKQGSQNVSMNQTVSIGKYQRTTSNQNTGIYGNSADMAPLILSSLEKVYKNLNENHSRLENLILHSNGFSQS